MKIILRAGRYLIVIFAVNIVYSCSENENTETKADEFYRPGKEVKAFEGLFYTAEENDKTKNIELVENCFTGSLDMIEIASFDNIETGEVCTISFNSHHVESYYFTSSELKDDVLYFSAESADEFRMSEKPDVLKFKMYKKTESVWILEEEGMGEYILVEFEDSEKFPFIPCEEDEDNGLTDEHIQKMITDVLFSLKNLGEGIQKLIPEAGIRIETPGYGMYTNIDTVFNVSDIREKDLFNNSIYENCLKNIKKHQNEEKTFIYFKDELPDFCLPEKEGLFVSYGHTYDETGPVEIKAMLTYYDETGNGFYTFCVLKFQYFEQLFMTDIDARECGV